MAMLRALTGMALAGLVTAASAASGPPMPITQYETPSEQRWAPFFPDLPGCDDPSVLSLISGRFGETENTYWGGAAAIQTFTRTRDIGFRANGLAYLPRRYCVAKAEVYDPRLPPPEQTREHTVIYNVTSAAGIIGWDWGVQWCVLGFDREHAYEPSCDVLRPILERWIGEPIGAAWLKARY